MTKQRLYIGELAKRVGVNPKTIRYYEEIGLLPGPERTTLNYRVYRPDDARRLEFIKKAQVLGLSLAEIREILSIRESGWLPCEHVRALLTHKLEELDRHITQMKAFRRELAQYLTELEERSYAGKEEAICPHIEGFPGLPSSHPLSDRTGHAGRRPRGADRHRQRRATRRGARVDLDGDGTFEATVALFKGHLRGTVPSENALKITQLFQEGIQFI